MTKNIGKSIRTRLLNLAKEEKQEYMKVLVRYLHERLLFRISASPYKSHFLLKGSSLLFALDGFKARPTIDIDLLGERISNERNFFMVQTSFSNLNCSLPSGEHRIRLAERKGFPPVDNAYLTTPRVSCQYFFKKNV